MSKELPFFKFFPGEWLQGDITLEDYEMQGIFINVCAYYWSKDCNLEKETLFKKFKGSLSQVEAMLKLGLIKAKGTLVKIDFLDEQFKELIERKSMLSEAGKKGYQEKKRREAQAWLKGGLSNKEEEKEIDKEREFTILQKFKDNVFKEAKELHIKDSITIKFLEHWTERDFDSGLFAWQVPETFIIRSRLKGWLNGTKKETKSNFVPPT